MSLRRRGFLIQINLVGNFEQVQGGHEPANRIGHI